mgnify:CR=1 FL=1|tara:strand:+ start:161 stop:358 length:198 start_codon:yes stop_codon:yes gene_type:complete
MTSSIQLSIEDDELIVYLFEHDDEGREWIKASSSIEIRELKKVLQKLDSEENIKINKFEQWKNSQ